MKKIPLTQGKFAIVDDADYARVSAFNWQAHKANNTFYATRTIQLDGVKTMQSMHAFLMGTPSGMDTAHKNHNGLDNRRKNLLVLTRAEHLRSDRRAQSNNSSGFLGVALKKSRWQAYLTHDRRRAHLGYFNTPEEAARARDAKARELGWPESGMNFPFDSRLVPQHIPGWKSTNTSGFRGVSYYKPNQKWGANIYFRGARHFLGLFDTPQEAASARAEFSLMMSVQ